MGRSGFNFHGISPSYELNYFSNAIENAGSSDRKNGRPFITREETELKKNTWIALDLEFSQIFDFCSTQQGRRQRSLAFGTDFCVE